MAINFIEKLRSLNIPFEVSRLGNSQVEIEIDNGSLTPEEAQILRNSAKMIIFQKLTKEGKTNLNTWESVSVHTALTALKILASDSEDAFLISTGNICTFYGDANTTKTTPHSYPPSTRFDNS